MSKQQSDTDSLCGWTIINKGSCIETAHEQDDALERPLLGEAQQDTAVNDCSLDETVVDKTILETLSASELVGSPEPSDEDLLCFSDHSDIVSLDYQRESKNAEDNQEFYFGAACSSQYAFTLQNTVEPPAVAHTSSSEDQAEESSNGTCRRRRLRRNTTSLTPREEEAYEYGQLMRAEVEKDLRCRAMKITFLLLLLLAFCVTTGCFFAALLTGTMRLLESPDKASELRLDELQDIWGPLQTHITFQDLRQLDDQKVFSLLVKVLLKVHKENQELQALQDQDEDLLKRERRKRTKDLLEQQKLSLIFMQEQLRDLNLKIQHSPPIGVVTPLQSKTKRLKLELVRQKQISSSFDGQRDELLAEVQILRSKLDTAEKVREVLKQKIIGLKTKKMEKDHELQEVKSQLAALETKLNFEQQRSDMWERLYVETTAREKGDTESKWKKTDNMAEKLKKTYQKAKEAVKVNLRKFTDSFKPTLRRIKDSASTILNKARVLYSTKCNKGAAGPEAYFREFHRTDESDYHNTRKSSDNSHQGQGHNDGRFFADQDLNDMRPVRAEEFDLLLESYLQLVGLGHNWTELKPFVSKFFSNGFFVHHQMRFQDFLSRVKSRLARMNDGKQFEDLDIYVKRFFESDFRNDCGAW